MGKKSHRKSEWRQLGVLGFVALVIMTLDIRTAALNPVRNVLSVVLSPVTFLSSIPASLSRSITSTLSAEPDAELAYENLRSDYFQLKSEALLLRSLRRENEDLRSLLGASQRLQEQVSLAELVNVSISRDQHTVMLDKGLRHGVYQGQAIIDDRGVIGQVTDVMPSNSLVMLITDPSHGLPVQLQRTGLRALVLGTGNVSELKVPFLNQNSDIRIGDQLVSSGLGNRFPYGYPVAEVVSVDIVQDEKFLQVSAKPVARLDRSNHVLLLSRSQSANSLKAAASEETEQAKQ